jgi:hypothetical protein
MSTCVSVKLHFNNNNNNNNNNNIIITTIIHFNSILYYLRAESTALRPITDTAQCTYKYLHCGAIQHRIKGKLQSSTGENTY